MKYDGFVTDIDQFSTHDGPGIRTAVFLQGCPLQCQWCHSPETQAAYPVLLYQGEKCVCCQNCITVCPQKAVTPDFRVSGNESLRGVIIDREKCGDCMLCTKTCSGQALIPSSKRRSVDEIMSILLGNKPFFANSGGGVTITGGELLTQPEFVLELVKRCSGEGVHTAIETSGFGSFGHLKCIAEFSDLIFYDIKHMDEEKHRQFTGAGNRQILDNLRKLCRESEQASKIVVRIPCIPDVNDTEENIMETADFAAALGIRYLELLPYNESAGAKYLWLQKNYLMGDKKTREKSYYQSMEKRVQQKYKLTKWSRT